MKCGQKDCTDEARWDVFWPGQTTCSCDKHARALLNLAAVMGFVLDVRLMAGGDKSDETASGAGLS